MNFVLSAPRHWFAAGSSSYGDWVYVAGGSVKTFEKINVRTGEVVKLKDFVTSSLFEYHLIQW